jgi:hypothetical protein
VSSLFKAHSLDIRISIVTLWTLYKWTGIPQESRTLLQGCFHATSVRAECSAAAYRRLFLTIVYTYHDGISIKRNCYDVNARQGLLTQCIHWS